MNLDYKILPFELKSASGDGSEGNGFANAFHNLDSAQEIVAAGAFAESLPEFLSVGFMGGLNHNWDMPIGRPTLAEEQEKGLYVGWKISDTTHGRDVKTLLKDGVIRKLSIGYRVQGAEMLEDADAVVAYWNSVGYIPSAEDIARAKHGARLLTKIHLYEFSPVTVPANSMADITRVKADVPDAFESIVEAEEWLRKAALPLSHTDSRRYVHALKHRIAILLRKADEEPSGTTETPEIETEATAEPEEPALVRRATEPEKAASADVLALHNRFLDLRAKFAARA